MNKAIISVILLAMLLFGIVPLAFAGQPPIDDTTLYVGQTSVSRIRADPKRAYDTFSGYIIMNNYDTLVVSKDEDHTTFLSSLASAWGKDVDGVYTGTEEEPVWWFTCDLTGKVFQTWVDRNGDSHVADPVTMEDVLYSFELGFVEDLSGAPQWMFWLPLFESMNMAPFYGTTTALKDLADTMADTIWVDGNTIFFRMAFPFPDTAWEQIMSQSWASIMNKEWAIDRGCWDGEWLKTDVNGVAVGTGTGAQTMFQILYDMPLGGTDRGVPVIDGTLSVYLDGVLTTDYTTYNRNGTIYFNTAPGNGVAITADYDSAHFYLYRRFPGGAYSYSPIDQKLPDYPQAQYDNYRMCGSGPYKMTTIDFTSEYCQLDKFDGYWGGWAGNHLDRIVLDWTAGDTDQWTTRLTRFLAGDYDQIAVPRDSMFDLFAEGWELDDPKTWLPVDGVYGIKNILPQISLDAIHFVLSFDGELSSYDGTGEIGAGEGIPTDFFNTMEMRRAFAYMFDYETFLADAYYGEAEQTATWSVKGLDPDYADPTVTGYAKDLDLAKADLQTAMFTKDSTTQSAWDWGFTFTIAYNSGNKPRQIMCNIIRDALIELSSMYGEAGHFSCDIQEIDWGTYLEMFEYYEMPIFTIGWLQDFSDPDNFARPYMHSEGDFSWFQNYYLSDQSPYVDQLLDWGIHNATYLADGVTPNAEREWCYHELQRIYKEDVVSLPIDQVYGRYWCRTWVKNWYFNALRPGFYYYDLFKQDGDIDDIDDQVNVVCDLNFDNIVDMKDIGITIKAFGQVPGGAKWNYLADVSQNMGDRKVDMKDIGWVVKKFGWAAAEP